jgi:hypothetical protein
MILAIVSARLYSATWPKTPGVRLMVLARLSQLLVGCTLSCAAVPACASLIAPPLDAAVCFESLGAAAAGADSPGNPAPESTPPPDSPRRDSQFSLPVADRVPSGQQSTSGAGGNNPSANSPFGECWVVIHVSAPCSNCSPVEWLREISWLAVPVPTGVDLLRPPQAAE